MKGKMREKTNNAILTNILVPIQDVDPLLLKAWGQTLENSEVEVGRAIGEMIKRACDWFDKQRREEELDLLHKKYKL